MGLRSGATSHALDRLREATDNLSDNADLADAMASSGHAALAQIQATADWLADHQPDVRVAVLTGRVHALAPVVEDADPDRALQLAATLYNGDQVALVLWAQAWSRWPTASHPRQGAPCGMGCCARVGRGRRGQGLCS